MNNDRFHDFVYKAENIIDELVIVLLSVGAITVSVYTFFFSSQNVDFLQFGRIIFPWITMLGLMVIGRELWIMNRKISAYLDQQTGEQ
jgi:peptidoglycan/LPS O-acetylase OafA/YrhL